MPRRSLRRAVMFSLGATLPVRAGAQQPARLSIVQQVKELSAINAALTAYDADATRLRLKDAGIDSIHVDSLTWFIADPLCAKPQAPPPPPTTLSPAPVKRNWCSVLYSPIDSQAHLLTPTADLIDRAYAVVQAELAAKPQSLDGFLSTPLSPTGYARAAGVADFILERAKDEVVVSFALDFRDRLTKNALFQDTFRRTISATADLESRNVKELLPTIRSAFVADLDSLPLALLEDKTMSALVEVLKSRAPDSDKVKIQARFDALKPALPYARVVGNRLYQIARGQNPLVAVSTMETITAAQLPNTDARAAFITGAIVAREYHSAGPDLRAMSEDGKSRAYLLAFLLRDVANDVNDNRTLMDWTPTFVKEHQADLVKLVDVAHDIQSQIDQLRTDSHTGSGGVDLIAGGVVHSAAELIDAVDSLVPSPKPEGWSQSKKIVDGVDRIHTALASRQYVTGFVELSTFVVDEFGTHIPPTYTLVLNTAASIASAQTAEEASAALEAAAEPVLSFRAKRAQSDSHGSTMLGINAYAAYSYGSENAFGPGFATTHTQYTGLAMPIGLEGSVATGGTRISSFSLFVPLVDLGAIGTFRLNDAGKTENAPSITLSQIIAPGAYAVFGFSKTVPISLGAGAQYVAGLRRSQVGTPLNTVRAGVWLGIDVPLFHF